jgi:hypothetical protein
MTSKEKAIFFNDFCMDYVRLNHNLVHLVFFFLEFCLAVQRVLSQIVDVLSTG